MPIFFLFLLFLVIPIISLAVVFSKAGRPGIIAFIPIFNMYTWFKVGRNSGWLTLLLFIPVVNVIILFINTLGIAKAFGKGSLFGLGLYFMPFLFYPILAFGSAKYIGNASQKADYINQQVAEQVKIQMQREQLKHNQKINKSNTLKEDDLFNEASPFDA